MDNRISKYYKDIENTEGYTEKLLRFHLESIEDICDLRENIVISSMDIIRKISTIQDISKDEKQLISGVTKKILKKTDINMKDFRNIKKLADIVDYIQIIEESSLKKYTDIYDFFISNIKAMVLSIMMIIFLFLFVCVSMFPYAIYIVTKPQWMTNIDDENLYMITMNIVSIMSLLSNSVAIGKIIKFLFDNGIKIIFIKNLNSIYSLFNCESKIHVIPKDSQIFLENIMNDIDDSADILEETILKTKSHTIKSFKSRIKSRRRHSMVKSKKICEYGKILNPKTNRCININGRLAQSLQKN